jgi:hypothetical protein
MPYRLSLPFLFLLTEDIHPFTEHGLPSREMWGFLS